MEPAPVEQPPMEPAPVEQPHHLPDLSRLGSSGEGTN
jgi:hypothetical protein